MNSLRCLKVTYCEQQSPKVDPRQVYPPVAPCVLPHRALVETLDVEEAAAEEDDRVAVDKVVAVRTEEERTEEDEDKLLQVPARELQPVPQ